MKSILNLKNVATMLACFAVSLCFTSCEPADEPDPDAPAFVEFSFANQRDASDIDTKKRTVKAVAECGTNIASLAPEFKLSPDGATATVDGKPQESGKTAQNFAEPVVYTIATPDGETADWTVTVTLPDDCPTVKKYITYNKPVTAYYIEYKNGRIDAYENKEFAGYYDGELVYRYPNGYSLARYDGQGYWTRMWEDKDPQKAAEWVESGYKGWIWPLSEFAAFTTGMQTSTLADVAESTLFQFPVNKDVTQWFIRSEKVGDTMCDVYQYSYRIGGVPGSVTWWIDPATAFTLKQETVENNKTTTSFEVAKLVIGSPDWDGKHLHPLPTDEIKDF